jgi:hypothetical protein
MVEILLVIRSELRSKKGTCVPKRKRERRSKKPEKKEKKSLSTLPPTAKKQLEALGGYI